MKHGWNNQDPETSAMHRAVPAALMLVACTLLSTFAIGATFDLSWYTIDGGGERFTTGGNYELRGTIGQPDASPVLLGGDFEVTGGFWFPIPPGDCEDDGDVDLFDYDLFKSCLTGPDGFVASECRCFDVNRSGAVDLLDFAVVQRNFTGS